MTKYILHGGNTSTPNKWNKEFYTEIGKDVPENSQVLLVYFSRREEEYNQLFAQDKQRIIDNAGGKKLTFVSANKKDFLDQVRKSQAIYMRGGETMQLINTLKQYPEFTELLEGKTIAGSSAGAYAMSKYFYSPSEGGVFEGLGILPVRINCHWDGGQKAIDELNKYPKDLEMILLKDSELKVIKS